MKKIATEVNFDSLVGPTHNFAGLSFGNIASTTNQKKSSNPKIAALQGLEKMYFLHKQGFKQGILPPHPRPFFQILENLGFDSLKTALEQNPTLVKNLCSSSFMWAANMATFSPSSDCLDNKVHITPANLINKFHRSIEADTSYELLRQIFNDSRYFSVHKPLFAHDIFSDEGAANHNRLCSEHTNAGLEIFVYGKLAGHDSQKTLKFPARQSLLASQSVARLHKLKADLTFFLQQNPQAIDEGAFHNDVVCVMNENVILCHELAFIDQEKVLLTIKKAYENSFNKELFIITINNKDLSLNNAVSSYLFNSQLLTKNNGKMLLFAPLESRENSFSNNAIQKIIGDNNPIDEVAFFDISQSMANGGGPACLRLRCVLSEEEFASINKNILLNNTNYEELKYSINKHYPETFDLSYLIDNTYLNTIKKALDNIYQVLGLEIR